MTQSCIVNSSMAYSLWYRFQKREYTRQKRTEFYPWDWKSNAELCLGTKSRNLGDALILTPLFKKLPETYPELKLSGFIRAFNPVVLKNQPAVTRIERGPSQLFGDDINLGSGHMIEQKFNWFQLPYTQDEVKPLIFLSLEERAQAQETLNQLFPENLEPLWILHPWGKTWNSLLSKETWETWVAAIPKTHRILQIGMPGEKRILGAKFYELNPTTHQSARELFALMEQAQRFIGVDSGPMHVASAFSVKALILVQTAAEGILAEGMALRSSLPYFHPKVRHFSNLYQSQSHLETSDALFQKKGFDWIQS
jgi:hypothetical protein